LIQSKFKNTAAEASSVSCFGGAIMDTERKPVRSRTSEMIIGNTTYIVTTSFNENARETVEQKLIRYVASCISSDNRNLHAKLAQ
jgi:hypothetical protein